MFRTFLFLSILLLTFTSPAFSDEEEAAQTRPNPLMIQEQSARKNIQKTTMTQSGVPGANIYMSEEEEAQTRKVSNSQMTKGTAVSNQQTATKIGKDKKTAMP